MTVQNSYMLNCKLGMILLCTSLLIVISFFSTQRVAFWPKTLVVYQEEELIKKQKAVKIKGQLKPTL